MKQRYKFLLLGSIFTSVAITTTSLIMINKRKKVEATNDKEFRYIVPDKEDPSKANIDYTTLLINKLADKLTEAQNFVRNNNNLKDDQKIINLKEKIDSSTKNLSATIKDNDLIVKEIMEIDELLSEAIRKTNNNTNIINGDSIVNIPLDQAKNNIREELNNVIKEIEKVSSEVNDQSLNEVTKNANEYISLAKRALDEVDNVNKLQAYLTISLDKKTEVLLNVQKIQERKNEIKESLLNIKKTLDNLKIFFAGKNDDANLLESISRYLVFNFDKFDIYAEGNNYISEFLNYYNEINNSQNNDKVILPKNISHAKNKIIEFLNMISNDEKFINNINNVQLKTLEKLDKIIGNWLFPNYTVNRFYENNNSVVNRFTKYKSTDVYAGTYDIYLQGQNQNRDQNINYEIKNFSKDTKNSDWMWLDNIKNEKLFSNNEIIENNTKLKETFKFDSLLNEINKLSIKAFETQLNKLKTFIDENVSNDEITLLDFANIIYSDDFINESFLAYDNDLNEIYFNSEWMHGAKINSRKERLANFSKYYKKILESFKLYANDEDKNIKINIKEIKDKFLENINHFKNQINTNNVSLNYLNQISTGDFRDLFTSSIMWKFNEKLLSLKQNENIFDASKDELINENKNSEISPKQKDRENEKFYSQYNHKSYKNWYESKDKDYKNNILELLSNFETNINDTIFQNNAILLNFDEDYDLNTIKYSRGDKKYSEFLWKIDDNENKAKSKDVFTYNENGIGENFRNNLQNGFDMFIYNLSNQNNNKESLNAIYKYISDAFESKKEFFAKDENKINTDEIQRKHLSQDNGKGQNKLDFNEIHIKNRFKKLVDLINSTDIKFATISKSENLKSNNTNLNEWNVLLQGSKQKWNYPLQQTKELSQIHYLPEYYYYNHFVNFKNFINFKYNNILINYEIIYTLVKIADFINSNTYDDVKMKQIWDKFVSNFMSQSDKDYEVDYFVTQGDYTVSNELKELLENK
ncbi:hypothetical protein [Mycoplasma sp. OR1901]|uniref:hypothetical protein n=1 Tax=Mycoplasma sp. OR1901 TaxID=2742195 RepID=UPI001582C7FB|nr:hypothetical protein [Mycoplasma sp. OR1901]QKT05464.1 hypothetical protein HTZ87_01970 [Mycoplasma sp. OR1901]